MSHKKNLTEEQRLQNQRDYYAKNKAHKQAVKKAWADANPDKVRNTFLRARYGITLEQYEHMFTECNGKCMICNLPSDEALYVDRCHDKGDIRGLLCGSCNFALGHFKDSLDILLSAVKYITDKPKIAAEDLLHEPRRYKNKPWKPPAKGQNFKTLPSILEPL